MEDLNKYPFYVAHTEDALNVEVCMFDVLESNKDQADFNRWVDNGALLELEGKDKKRHDRIFFEHACADKDMCLSWNNNNDACKCVRSVFTTPQQYHAYKRFLKGMIWEGIMKL